VNDVRGNGLYITFSAFMGLPCEPIADQVLEPIDFHFSETQLQDTASVPGVSLTLTYIVHRPLIINRSSWVCSPHEVRSLN